MYATMNLKVYYNAVWVIAWVTAGYRLVFIWFCNLDVKVELAFIIFRRSVLTIHRKVLSLSVKRRVNHTKMRQMPNNSWSNNQHVPYFDHHEKYFMLGLNSFNPCRVSIGFLRRSTALKTVSWNYAQIES